MKFLDRVRFVYKNNNKQQTSRPSAEAPSSLWSSSLSSQQILLALRFTFRHDLVYTTLAYAFHLVSNLVRSFDHYFVAPLILRYATHDLRDLVWTVTPLSRNLLFIFTEFAIFLAEFLFVEN